MDEQDFVQFLEKNFSFRAGFGIGDDASVVKAGDTYQIITKDILIENVHFKLDYFNLEEIALKSLAVNLSDIAAMGGTAEYFYLGLGFPTRLAESKIFDFFKGLKKGCRQWQVELAGGDFSVSPSLFISITLVGRAQRPVYRSGAQKNDLIAITGPSGESAVGLKLLGKGKRTGYFVRKHKVVKPEIGKGLILSRFVNAMIDVSDGLLIDLKRILTASKKGAHIFYEAMPVSDKMRQVCQEYGFDEYDAVLAGGEDYVLLFTFSPEKEPKLREQDIGYHIIGKITDQTDYLLVKHHDRVIHTKDLGYDHFQDRNRS